MADRDSQFWPLNKQDEALDDSIAAAQKVLDRLEDRKTNRIAQRKGAVVAKHFGTSDPDKAQFTIEKLFGIDYMILDGLGWYEAIQKFINQWRAKGVIDTGGCHYVEGGAAQRCLSVCMYADVPAEEQFGILDFLPFLKPLQGEEYKEVSVLPTDGWEENQPALRFYPDKVVAGNNCHFHWTDEAEFPEAESALRWVHENHPYARDIEDGELAHEGSEDEDEE